MILVIDNYDSFTYNLVQILGSSTDSVVVKRNDCTTVAEISSLAPRGILLSPGPGRPENAGISMDIIRDFGQRIPILGVCLGHQAIGLAYGGKVVYAPALMHGRTSIIRHAGSSLYEEIPTLFDATRYHSLIVERSTLPNTLRITAETDDGIIMGLQHAEYPVEGVQFHPESILTAHGAHMLSNWLRRCS